MLLIDTLAEEHIQAAIKRGELDGLRGMGRPLALEDDSAVPEELRAAYRLLRNAGCLPPELTLINEISEVEALLERVEDGAEQDRVRRRLCLLRARLAAQGRDVNLLATAGPYRDKLARKLAAENTCPRRARDPGDSG